ncbi:MAG: AMED_5909 family protein [Pseudonocardiaceae bacterium]
MTGDEATEQDPPRTLMEAQVALALIRPRRQAPLGEWLAYYQRSTGWYAEIAEIDRGHHHEALYMAEQERERAKEIETQIRAGMSMGGEGCGKDRNTGAAADVDAGS